MRELNKTLHMFLVFFITFGMVFMSYQPPILAANTTNNDIIFRCSQYIVEVGKVIDLEASIEPASEKSLKWKVSNPEVVYLVSKKGGKTKVKGLKEGTSTITVYHGNGSNIGNGNKSVSCTIEVKPGRTTQPTEDPEPTQPPQDTELEAKMEAESGIIDKLPGINAAGKINVTILPKQINSNHSRENVNVVFVVDQSSSMSLQELQKVNEAIQAAKSKFNPSKDKLGLVTFNEKVINKINLTNNFSSLNNVLSSNDGTGNADYNNVLNEVKGMFGTASGKKIIIFVSGGKPVQTIINERVEKNISNTSDNGYDSGNYDVTYLMGNTISKYFTSNKNDTKIIEFTGVSIDHVLPKISSKVEDKAKILKDNNINVYTIGMDTDSAINDILSNLSTTTGGSAAQATMTQLSEKLNTITNQITSNIKLTDIKFKLKIRNTESLGDLAAYVQAASNPKVQFDGVYAVLSLDDVIYPSDGTLPTIPPSSLPLEFSRDGKYIFDEAVLQYVDQDLKPKTYTLSKDNPVIIDVRNQGEPGLTGAMNFDSQQSVGNLVVSEDENLARNLFTINYTLIPLKPNGASTNSNLTNIKLLQRLPNGVVLAPNNSPGIKGIKDITGTRDEMVEIDFGAISYNSSGFTPTSISRQLKLNVEWAVNTPIENPTVFYKNNNNVEKSFVIQAPTQRIQAKVQLLDIDNPDYMYQGDETGIVSKIKKSDGTEKVSASITSDPIKMLRYADEYDNDGNATKNTNLLQVVSKNVEENEDYEDYVALAPTIELTRAESKTIIEDEQPIPVSKEDVVAKLDELVFDLNPNGGVNYQYQITENGSTSGWRSLGTSEEIRISGEDNTEIEFKFEVKATGGFSNGKIVAREFKINKQINHPPVAGSIEDQTLIVGGQSKTIDITNAFSDEDGDILTIGLGNIKVISGAADASNIVDVKLVNNQPVITSKMIPGVVEITIIADDGREGSAEITFTVTVVDNHPPSALPITNQTMTLGQLLKLDLSQFFTDEDGDNLAYSATARDKTDSTDMTLTKAAVSVNGNELTITAKELGTVEITVTASDGKGGTVSTTFTVSIILPNPDFHFVQDSVYLIGKQAFVKITAYNETIMDNTDWYKYEFDGTKWDWVKFHTGKLPNQTGTVAIKLENITNDVIQLQIKAVTPKINPVIKDLEFSPKKFALDDSKTNIKIDVSKSQGIEASGDRAARIAISYKVTLPLTGLKGDPVFLNVDADGYVPGLPKYTIKAVNSNSNSSITGNLRTDGINKQSTPVVKFIKSPTGKSLKFNVEAKVRLLVETDLGEKIDLKLLGTETVDVLSRDKLK